MKIIPKYENTHSCRGRRVVVIVWWVDLQLPMQSVTITRDIQHYVIKFVLLEAGQWFSPGTLVSFTNKIDCQTI